MAHFVIFRRVAAALLVVLPALALLLASDAVAASETTIGFDGLAAGTVVTSQYAADGITFGRASDYGLTLGNSDCGPPQVTADPTGSRSAPNVATAPRCTVSDSSSVGTFAAFSFPRRTVSAYVGTAPGDPGVKAIMIGYDSSGTFVSYTPQTTIGAGANTLLSISSNSANIAYLSIYIEGVVGGGTPLLIDDLTVDNSAAPLTATGRPFSAVAGSSFSGVVGHIADGDPTATASDYGVSVGWGDGRSSAGSMAAAAGGGFNVTGTHTYAAVGSDTVTLSLTKVNGRTASGSGTATVTSGTTTTTTTTPAPPAHVSFSAPAGAAAGQPVGLAASSSRPGGTYEWSVNGHELADCAGVTSGLMTRTLPAGSDTILLRQVDATGASVVASRQIVVRPSSTAREAAAGGVRVVRLPPVAVCQSIAGDLRGARVAPAVAYAPGAGCTTQVKSGVIDAVGCLTEYKDTIHVMFARNQRGHLGTQKVTLPAGQAGLDGVSSAEDTTALLKDVENALNPPHPRLCVDSQGNDFICSTVGVEQQPAGPSFGGVPAEAGGPVAGQAARDATRPLVSAAAAAAREIAFSGDACTVAPTKQAAGESECLDVWVSNGPVRINGIDYAPASGGEIVLAPQFNLLISQQASTSLDGLLLNAAHPFQLVNFELPPGAAAGGASPGVDYPGLTVPDLPADIARQRSLPEAASIISKLGSIGGFPERRGARDLLRRRHGGRDPPRAVAGAVQRRRRPGHRGRGGQGRANGAVPHRVRLSRRHVRWLAGGPRARRAERLWHLLPRALQPGYLGRSVPRDHQHRRRWDFRVRPGWRAAASISAAHSMSSSDPDPIRSPGARSRSRSGSRSAATAGSHKPARRSTSRARGGSRSSPASRSPASRPASNRPRPTPSTVVASG